MKTLITIFLTVLITVGLIVGGYSFLTEEKQINMGGSVFSKIATSSTISVGRDITTTIFSKRNTCSARTIQTYGNILMLSFDPDITPTKTTGIIQAASTTKAYDSDVWGCGAVTGVSYVATTTIYKSENTF